VRTKPAPAISFNVSDSKAKNLNETEGIVVELRRYRAGKTMRWTPQIMNKDNGGAAQIVRNNVAAAGMV